MKKGLCLLLVVLCLALLAGCNTEEAKAPAQTQPQAQTTTLMIYMVGSDLEAKAGAASKDLQEIADSGVDLEKVNVLVYVGGTPNWHNEVADVQTHRVLQLTPEGFRPMAATAPSSMGESECLTKFLALAWEKMPADQFALILWDHGDGPVIGYGRDMLFDNDSLTLKEMATALEASPFGPENKLAWVGFDACLMASAELCCTWEPYADFLVASQEVEPSFGWDYSFLSGMGTKPTRQLLTDATQAYLQACQEYYDKRGYEHRDTTLSCMELCHSQQLQEALGALFARADAGIDGQYHQLVVRRVSTRALGRTTTGSEYDLIDVKDLARQLADLYPQEAQAVEAAVDKMTVANATNTTGCCGMSLYYPFYNKDYYSRSWSQAYRELGLLPQYQKYLQSYEQRWLKNDLLTTVAASQLPMDTAGTYTLQLTPEQNETLASARFYILSRNGEQLYTPLFVSENVTNQNGLLTANFDGNVIYVRNNYGTYHIPPTREHDTVDGVTRYSVYTTLINCDFDSWYVFANGYDTVYEPYRFHLGLDNASKTLSVNGLAPYDFQEEALSGGKYEDAKLSDWGDCFFYNEPHRYLTRNDQGTILALGQWPDNGWMDGIIMPVGDGVEFEYAPLTEGEYYLMFELEDTQGSRYCSELLSIQVHGQLPDAPVPQPWDIAFTSGQRVTLAETGGVTVNLLLAEEADDELVTGYRLEVINTNDYPVTAAVEDLYWGQDLYCGSYVDSLYALPGETAVSQYGFELPPEVTLETGDGMTMSLFLSLENSITGHHLLWNQPVRIQLSQETLVWPKDVDVRLSFGQPIFDAWAQEQVLMDNDQMKVTLMGLGGRVPADEWEAFLGNREINATVCVENRTDEFLPIGLLGMCADGRFVSAVGDSDRIPPHCRVYQSISILGHKLEETGMTSMESISLLLQQDVYSALYTGGTRSELICCPVVLSQRGTAQPMPKGQKLLEENGIRVSLLSTEVTASSHNWLVLIENTTDNAYRVELTDPSWKVISATFGDETAPYISDGQVGPHQYTVAEIIFYYGEGVELPQDSIEMRLKVQDFFKESIAFSSSGVISLRIET